MNTLGERLSWARNQRGKTQRQIATAVGVSVQAVSNWENGKSEPEFSRLQILARALAVSVGWLVSGEDAAQNEAEVVAQARGSVPLVTIDQTVFFAEFTQFLKLAESDLPRIQTNHVFSGHGFAIQVTESEAAGPFTVGDILVFDNGIKEQDGDIVLVVYFAPLAGPFLRRAIDLPVQDRHGRFGLLLRKLDDSTEVPNQEEVKRTFGEPFAVMVEHIRSRASAKSTSG